MTPNAAIRPEPGPATEAQRLPRTDRRDALLDAAAALVAEGDIEAVSMESVAEGAHVSRPLVYKHFANRSELLEALYQRESALLHAELAAEVQAATTVEAMFRALIRGSLRAQAERAATFAALRAAGARNSARRQEQHSRDRTTVRWFTSRVVKELGVERQAAAIAVPILLGAVHSVLLQWRLHPTPEHAADLEETYVRLVVSGLRGLASEHDEFRAEG